MKLGIALADECTGRAEVSRASQSLLNARSGEMGARRRPAAHVGIAGDAWPLSVLNDVPTPAAVVSTDLAASRVAAFREHLPGVAVLYAVKAFDDELLIKTLAGHVDGFDVASLAEIQSVLAIGVAPQRLTFSNPVKIPAHIAEAYRLGVRWFAADSRDEIAKLAAHAPKSDVFLRLRVADTGSAVPLSSKFGVRPDDVETYARAATQAGLNVIGLSFHVGSQSTSVADWLTALRVATAAMERLAETGIRIEVLNLGGGFPAVYQPRDIGKFQAIATAVTGFLASKLPEGVRVVAEPGRFIAAHAAVMVATVIATEVRSGARWAHLNLGAYQGLIEPMQLPDWHYPVTNLSRPGATDWDSFTLTGPTCDSFDTIGHGYRLPADTQVGDRILFEAAGAYSLVFGCSFNGFPPPGVVHV